MEKNPLTLEEAQEIQDSAERIFAIAVAQIDHLDIYYEPVKFHSNGNGSTVPDFLVINRCRPNDLQQGKYIEVTKGRNGHPRKKKQQRIMKSLGLPYVQLSHESISSIQMHPKENELNDLPSAVQSLDI